MAADAKYLTMFLEAPSQSWGLQSKFDRRGTHSLPTKSAVIGILSAALGLPRSDRDSIAKLAAMKYTCFAVQNGIELVDFQTVGVGYPKGDLIHKLPTADGKKRKQAVTHRTYIWDAKFGVIFEGPKDLIENCAKALQDPVYGVWLGRKVCIPTSPIYRGMYDTEEAAFASFKLSGAVKVVSDAREGEEASDRLMDSPVDFGRREHTLRPVAVNIEEF